VADWQKIIWSDESSFEVGKLSEKIRVWRKPTEKYCNECLVPTFKSGRTSVMIWGAFVNTTKLNLVFMESGKRTGPDFVEQVYEGSIQPFLTSDMCSDDMTLMEDGAPVHGCKVAKEWRENHGVSKIKWPANSPDMNPIENVWRRMKKSISKNHNIKTAAAMRIALQKEWDNIGDEVLSSLVESMPDRIQAVLQADGGHTRW
jgi:transposase